MTRPPSEASPATAAASARAEVRALLQKAAARCAELPTALRVDTQRQPGAWRDHPLPPNSADAPYWIALPAALEITNIPSPALREVLAHTQPMPFGNGGSIVMIQAPARPTAASPTRADVSQAVLAKTIATLNAPSPLRPAIAAALARTGARATPQLAAQPADESITGNGTATAPFRVTNGQPLYVQAPVTLAFPNVPPSELAIASLFPSVSHA